MKLGDMIWGGHNGFLIMWKARQEFRDDVSQKVVSAYVALASAHYSLVKRWWAPWFSLWHAWRALVHANAAYIVSERGRLLSINQIDVVSRIFVTAILLRHEHRSCAKALVEYALQTHPLRNEMLPHARAHLLITLAMIHHDLEKKVIAIALVKEAADLEEMIRVETVKDAYAQLARVKSAVGFYLLEHGNESEQEEGRRQLRGALRVAQANSADQYRKIRLLVWWKRVEL